VHEATVPEGASLVNVGAWNEHPLLMEAIWAKIEAQLDGGEACLLGSRHSPRLVCGDGGAEEEDKDMEWADAIAQSELPEGSRQVVQLHEHSVLLIHQQGRIYAIASACPHMRLPLKGGKVSDGTIVCPWHHSAFGLGTGDVQEWSPWPPAVGKLLGKLSRERALPVFPTKVEDGRIWVGMGDGS
jgi:nitrite reductase/ring-hydroxylating ferredoxin subunit